MSKEIFWSLTEFPMLFKYTQKGQVQQWQIFSKDDHFWTEEGIQGGTITKSKPTYCKAKNVGKKNETNVREQAIAEAQAKWQKKVDSGYNEVLSDEKKFFEPMLAHKYEDVKINWGKERVFAQPKLDGLRAISHEDKLMSRNGKPYLACPHLLQNFYILDGELYNHEYHDDFNKIVSLCKKQKPTLEEYKESKDKVQFWAYDYPGKKGKFSERYAELKSVLDKLGNPAYKLVYTKEIKSEEELVEFHAENIANGFEGTIVRLDNKEYENKRSKSLLKYKDFIDEEFQIVGAEEGEGGRAGTIGKFWVRLDKNLPYSIEKEENVCKSNVKGNFDFLRQVWKDHKEYIGTDATIKYFGRTPDNSLRFPYIIKLNRAEYE